MTRFDPDFAPYQEIFYDLLIASSGQLNVGTKFNKVITALPIVENASSYPNNVFNGLTINHSGSVVSVFANCSGNADSGSGVLPNSSAHITLVVYGIQ